MKYAFIISIFLSAQLFSQISPPDLRCVEVLSNGDVKLTWIPPSDPTNVFDSYEIFSSISSSGPFSSVGNVGALVLTTFTHTGASANTQSKYYFVKTKFGPGGASSTAGSDTLRSIRLNVTQSTPALSIQYNNIHQPKLISSSATFTIAKEYPLGSWSNIGITPNLSYGDTISVCSASLNYLVSLQDASGCVSISNIQGGTFSDTKNPDEPVVDSISVLPNGNTVLAWHIPNDKDVKKYRIYENISGVYPGIDSVIGRNNTLYTYNNTKANSQPVAIYVSAIDSCNKIGSFDVTPTTMFLLAIYDTCHYSTLLTWNAYKGMRKGILEYRIYYSVNGSAFSRVGATTGTSFTHSNVDPSQNVCYFIRVVNTDQTITSSSNRYCFFSRQAQAPNFIYIKSASITSSNSAEIKIFIDISKGATGIDLTRSEDGVNYSAIAFLPFTGSDTYVYADESINAKTTSYYYKAVVRDGCGNPRTTSTAHKTILLSVQQDKEFEFNKHLHWTGYKGFAGNVSGYNIYRIVNDVQGSPVGATGPMDTTYTDNIEDEAPNGCKIEYLVEAVEGISDPYGFMEKSRSNIEQVYIDGRIFVPTAFAPKGINKIWLPVTHFVEKTEYTLRIFNRWGAKIFETTDDKQGWDGADAKDDMFVYLISYKNCRGEYLEVKGTFLML